MMKKINDLKKEIEDIEMMQILFEENDLKEAEKLIKKYEDKMGNIFKQEYMAARKDDYAEALKCSERWNALSDVTDELRKLL